VINLWMQLWTRLLVWRLRNSVLCQILWFVTRIG